MPKIVWTDDWSLDHPGIDAQHRRWLDIYNVAHDRMMGGDRPSVLTIAADALAGMIEYTRYHFRYEEAYMAEIRYPDIDNHRRIHDGFALRLNCFQQDLKAGRLVLNSDVIKVIESWLRGHILLEDQKIRAFVRKRKA